MDDTFPFLLAGFTVWLAAFSLQLADFGTARFDARRLARGKSTSVRLHPVAWVVPLAVLVVVLFGVGVVIVALIGVAGDLAGLAAGCALILALVTAGWFIVTDAATRPADDSYRAIRDELIDLSGTRVWHEWLDELRSRLDAIDGDTDRTRPPVEVSYRSATAWVFRRPQRALAPLLSVVVLVIAIVEAVRTPGLGWIVVAAVAALLLSCLLAVVSAHASLTLLAAVRDAQVKYRAEVVHLLSEAEKTSKKRVAGLGDRVARALEILRQQQD